MGPVNQYPALLVRFRPVTPWRFGPDSGDRERVDSICHSDTLYSAVTAAMGRLGLLEEWLDSTARSRETPAVRLSSLFPYQNDVRFIAPPNAIWPPPLARARWKTARFAPLPLVNSLLAEESPDENAWMVDGQSECLISSRRGSEGPFRVALRTGAAVDRVSGGEVQVHSCACMEFAPGAGLWGVAVFSGPEAAAQWSGKVQAALTLLADSGIGGERSRGWGRSGRPEFSETSFPEVILGRAEPAVQAPETDEASQPRQGAYWLLSLFNPAAADSVDWNRGCYSLVTRTGRVESPAAWGELKRPVRMVAEGSVLIADNAPHGGARDVAPPDFAHPVYRAGFAVSVPIPWRATA